MQVNRGFPQTFTAKYNCKVVHNLPFLQLGHPRTAEQDGRTLVGKQISHPANINLNVCSINIPLGQPSYSENFSSPREETGQNHGR